MPSAPRVGSARGTRHPVRFPWAVGAASGASRRVRTAGCRQRRGRSLPAARARPGAFLQRAAGSGPSARPCAPRAGWCRHRVSILAAAGCGCLCICVSVCHEGCVVGSSSSPRCSWSLGTVQSPLVALPPERWPWLVWVSVHRGRKINPLETATLLVRSLSSKSRWRVPVHLGGFQESGRAREGRATTSTHSLSPTLSHALGTSSSIPCGRGLFRPIRDALAHVGMCYAIAQLSEPPAPSPAHKRTSDPQPGSVASSRITA